MAPHSVPKSFRIGMAFIFAIGFAALVIVGSGISSVVRNTDDPLGFGVYVTWAGPILIFITTLGFALAALRAGLRFGERVRFGSILGIALTTYVVALIVQAVASLALDPQGAGAMLFTAITFVVSGPGWIILGAGFLAAWAYLGTLRWQYLNAETKQFHHPTIRGVPGD